MSTACAQPDMSGWDTPDSCSYLTDGYQTSLEGGFPAVVGVDFCDHSVFTHSFGGLSAQQKEKQRCMSFSKGIPAKRARRVDL